MRSCVNQLIINWYGLRASWYPYSQALEKSENLGTRIYKMDGGDMMEQITISTVAVVACCCKMLCYLAITSENVPFKTKTVVFISRGTFQIYSK